jgi:hypothetical protein|tara:strand:+ start:765 stop:986 length:222 start_codon:yes stop_codon:yes gene_type:complete
MRKFAIITIIILGMIILWKPTICPEPIPCETEQKNYKKTDSIEIKKIDEVSEYIPQTIRRSEEYIPQTQRSMT